MINFFFFVLPSPSNSRLSKLPDLSTYCAIFLPGPYSWHTLIVIYAMMTADQTKGRKEDGCFTLPTPHNTDLLLSDMTGWEVSLPASSLAPTSQEDIATGQGLRNKVMWPCSQSSGLIPRDFVITTIWLPILLLLCQVGNGKKKHNPLLLFAPIGKTNRQQDGQRQTTGWTEVGDSADKITDVHPLSFPAF